MPTHSQGSVCPPCGELLDRLRSYTVTRAFNQYRDDDPLLDLAGGADIRCHNLVSYFGAFQAARYVLVGEGAGYAGCRFSGIPFTCEDQLVGPIRLPWAAGRRLARSSQAPALWVERSARIVWGVLGHSRDFVLWNAFPWHPFGEKGPLSNRPPGRDLTHGLGVLRCALSLFPDAKPYAVGRVAEQALARIGVTAPYLRHPSHGGKARFQAGIEELKLQLHIPPPSQSRRPQITRRRPG